MSVVITARSRAQTSRRTFLRGLGAGAGLVPLLHGQRGDAAAAPVKRLFTFFWGNGIPQASFWPNASATLELSPVLKPLEAVKDDTTVLGAVDLECLLASGAQLYNGHGAGPAVLTGKKVIGYDRGNDGAGKAGGDSVDQFIGAELAKRHNLPAGCLVTGVRGGSGAVGAISYRGNGSTGITPEKDPVRLFNTLFGGRKLPEGTIDRLREKRKSILDVVGRQTEAFGARLAPEDKAAVQAHLESIRDIERQLKATPAASCATPAAPPAGLTSNDRTPDLYKVQADLLLAAMRCDFTRVITYQFSDGYGGLTFSWLGAEFTGSESIPGDNITSKDHHGLSHHQGYGPAQMSRFVRINTWFYEQVAYLAQKMKATPDGAGNMLDSSLIVVANHAGDNHVVVGLPFVLIGKAGGAVKPGRLVRVGSFAKRADKYWGGSTGSAGVPNGRLLLSLCHSMDVMVPEFGDSGSAGPIAELRG
jgi:hypothetical protein